MRRRPSGTQSDGEGGARVDSNSSIVPTPPTDLLIAPVTTADARAAAACAHNSIGGGAGGGGVGADSSAVDDDTDSDDAGIDTAELLALIEQAEQSQASETPQPGAPGVRAPLTRRTSSGAKKSDVRVPIGGTAPQPRRSPRKSGVASPPKHAKVHSPSKVRSTGSKPSDGSGSGGSSGAIRDISNMLTSATVNTDPEASQGASGSSSGGQ